LTYPDPPINFEEDLSVKLRNTLKLKWDYPSNDGGLKVLDYRIFIATENTDFIVLIENLKETAYTVTDLTEDTVYSFKV